MGRKAAWILSVLVLLNTGALGVYNGITELSQATTPLQKSVTTGVLIYGILGLAAAIAFIARRRPAVWLALAWTAVVTYVSSTAAFAYAAADATIGGAIAAGLGAAVIGLGIVWCAVVVTRPASLHDRVHADHSLTH
jgi:hypothetical protein